MARRVATYARSIRATMGAVAIVAPFGLGATIGHGYCDQPADWSSVTPTNAIVPSRNTRSATAWSLPSKADPIALVASDGEVTP
jgi:hypothetical protein